MLDVLIIGGGVCGLALAHSLQAKRVDWRLLEARDRLGGRVLTQAAGPAGDTPIDLGPTWFWPAHQPSITRLVSDLGLRAFPQTDDGRLLHLHDPNATPQTVAVGVSANGELHSGSAPDDPPAQGVHGGAMRIAGGMGALVQALAAPLPAARIQRGTAVHTLVDHGNCVAVHWTDAQGQACSLTARRVVLALPPRLAYSRLAFEPALSEAVSAALRHTPTWMATAAKAGMAYPRPFWREAGHSGNAWVTHPQAVLAEVFDASTPAQTDAASPHTPSSHAALAGFSALGASARPQFSAVGMALLLRSQLGQLFGAEAQDGELHTLDWALEPHTCSPLDLAEDSQPLAHPSYGEPLLTQPHWQGRLLFGGSETARQGGGYVEGALSAAARLRRELLQAPAAAAPEPLARARA